MEILKWSMVGALGVAICGVWMAIIYLVLKVINDEPWPLRFLMVCLGILATLSAIGGIGALGFFNFDG